MTTHNLIKHTPFSITSKNFGLINHGRITFFYYPFLLFLLSVHVTAQNSSSFPPPYPYNPNNVEPRFNLRMVVVMVLLIAVFFILGFISVYTRQCSENRVGANLAFGIGTPPRGGLDPSVIETFPTFIYSTVKSLKLGKDSLECAVCLNEFEDDETLRLIPKCDHVFHPDCIDHWLISHSTCPVCRANLVSKPGETSHNTLVQILNSDIESGQSELSHVSDERSIQVNEDRCRDSESPKVNLIGEIKKSTSDQSHPPRSKSTGFRSQSNGWLFNEFIRRSFSTGNSLIRTGENVERFTLRLPDGVRTQLMNYALNRTNSTSTMLPRVESGRRGYRSRSVDIGRQHSNSYNERSDRLLFSLMPPFIYRTSSVRTHQGMASYDVAKTFTSDSSRKLLPLDHLSGGDNVGERSCDPLRPENQV